MESHNWVNTKNLTSCMFPNVPVVLLNHLEKIDVILFFFFLKPFVNLVLFTIMLRHFEAKKLNKIKFIRTCKFDKHKFDVEK